MKELSENDIRIIEGTENVLEMVDLLLAEHSYLDFDSALQLLTCSAVMNMQKIILIEKGE